MFLLFSWHKAQLTEQEYDIAVTYAVEAVRIQPRQPASKIPYMLHTHTHAHTHTSFKAAHRGETKERLSENKNTEYKEC